MQYFWIFNVFFLTSTQVIKVLYGATGKEGNSQSSDKIFVPLLTCPKAGL